MISRSEGFANAFLAFLNPDKDLKGISEAPPTSCKPAAPVKAQKAKRSVNRKLPDDFLDEDDIPVLNIIPNRLEGDVRFSFLGVIFDLLSEYVLLGE